MSTTKTGKKRKPSQKIIRTIALPAPNPPCPTSLDFGADDPVYVAAIKNLETLLTCYGIPGGVKNPANGWVLAMCLAWDAVPGFKPYQSHARKIRQDVKWAGARDWILLRFGMETLMEKKMDPKKPSVRQAFFMLAEMWREKGYTGMSGQSLLDRYNYINRTFRKAGPTDGMKIAAKILNGGS